MIRPDLLTTSATSAAGLQRIVFGLLACIGGAAVGLLSNHISYSVVLVMVIGLGVLITTVVRPDAGYLLLVVIVYTRLSDVLVHTHGVPTIAQPFIMLLLGIILVRWKAYGERPTDWEVPVLLILGYGVVGFVSLVYTADFDRALNMFVTYVKDAIIAVVVLIGLRSLRGLRLAIWGVIFSGIFMATITTYQYLTGTFQNEYWGFGQAGVENIIGRFEDYRITGPIGDPNYYAQLLIVVVPLAVDRLLHERSMLGRLLSLWAIVVTVLSILFTFSRGGFLTLVIVGCCLVIRRRPKPIALLICAVLGLALIPFVPDRYTDRITTLLTFTGVKETGAAADLQFEDG